VLAVRLFVYLVRYPFPDALSAFFVFAKPQFATCIVRNECRKIWISRNQIILSVD